jgi:hypothetical protein
LQGVVIQKIHIISAGLYTGEELSKFPTDVTILNSVNEEDPATGVSGILFDRLGTYVQTSGYLIDGDQTILYAKINHGNFNDLALATISFTKSGKQAVQLNDEQPITSGEILKTDTLNFSAQHLKTLTDELSKPITVVLFSDKASCYVCNSWLSEADDFFKSWRDKGYGIILVERLEGQREIEVATLENGVLQVVDEIDAENKNSVLFKKWGVNIYPVLYILQNGSFQGQVAYTETEANGIIYRNAPFEVVSEITQNLNNFVD